MLSVDHVTKASVGEAAQRKLLTSSNEFLKVYQHLPPAVRQRQKHRIKGDIKLGEDVRARTEEPHSVCCCCFPLSVCGHSSLMWTEVDTLSLHDFDFVFEQGRVCVYHQGGAAVSHTANTTRCRQNSLLISTYQTQRNFVTPRPTSSISTTELCSHF